mmetsp:Transcript_7477/g.11664  ORF Transcript_7477/g.11664 Transcript_7477/m.11664 type:complete len:136 (+) Transcript_7477:527-934(+)|eukprot:CAMPEP_0170510056 /NCGR_PEP_ID=MMETSP0208-20121228/65555_1 /TAXON_ID=197538 /ORGANISM="Strombidium inclinatum, Strain S3" /LENGTH=135 /DNA_ID=CAMNT_0010793479 /DNA_START=1201 /DNA_END=1608 /DNA_ORIENTATION=+
MKKLHELKFKHYKQLKQAIGVVQDKIAETNSLIFADITDMNKFINSNIQGIVQQQPSYVEMGLQHQMMILAEIEAEFEEMLNLGECEPYLLEEKRDQVSKQTHLIKECFAKFNEFTTSEVSKIMQSIADRDQACS